MPNQAFQLTGEQQDAAFCSDTYARLLAGPGTGKTRVLTAHVVHLVAEKKVPPKSILVVTFTRAATKELSDRLAQALGQGAEVPRVSTLHSYALRTLLENQQKAAVPQPIRIADDYEEAEIITPFIRDLLGLKEKKEVDELFDELSADWQNNVTDPGSRLPNARFLGAWREHRDVFGYTLRAELVYQLRQCLSEGLVPRFSPAHLCVDEFQDLNACDLAVVRHLCDLGATLYAAGDDDQSIYGFRYARPDGIRAFGTQYSPFGDLKLTECKRCDRLILKLARFIADQDHRRTPKIITADAGACAGEVRILRFLDQHQEASNVAALCQKLTKEHDPGEILILLRGDRHGCMSGPLAHAFELRGVPYSVRADPFEILACPDLGNGKKQVEGRRFLALLRLLDDENDSLSWFTLLWLHAGIGSATLSDMYERARRQGVRFSDVVREIQATPSAMRRGSLVAQCVDKIDATLEANRNILTADLYVGLESLAAAAIADDGLRADVLRLLASVILKTGVATLSDLLRAMSASLESVEQDEDNARVNIMTMHQAKGLTKAVTIVVGAEQEYMPGRAVGEDADDERRLLYVSVTRAKHKLILTHCIRRTGRQCHTGANPGVEWRHLTEFLRGGPFASQDGPQYIATL